MISHARHVATCYMLLLSAANQVRVCCCLFHTDAPEATAVTAAVLVEYYFVVSILIVLVCTSTSNLSAWCRRCPRRASRTINTGRFHQQLKGDGGLTACRCKVPGREAIVYPALSVIKAWAGPLMVTRSQSACTRCERRGAAAGRHGAVRSDCATAILARNDTLGGDLAELLYYSMH